MGTVPINLVKGISQSLPYGIGRQINRTVLNNDSQDRFVAFLDFG